MFILPQTRGRFFIFLLAIWLVNSLCPLPVAGQQPNNAKWEYCRYAVIGNRATGKNVFSLTRGKEKIEAASLKELGEKLKMKDIPAFNLVVLDHLGEDGWELVSCTAYETPMFTNADYMLKRKR